MNDWKTKRGAEQNVTFEVFAVTAFKNSQNWCK